MTLRSWIHVEHEDPAYGLDPAIAAADPAGAVDCGWVTTMRPLIADYSEPGDRVLDPFAGFGTTLLAAHAEGRDAIGLEIDPGRAVLNRQRLLQHECPAELLVADARTPPLAPASCGLAIASVPFVTGAGPTADGQLSGRDLPAWEDLLAEVLDAMLGVLGEGRAAVLVLPNTVHDRVVPQAWAAARLLGERFELGEDRVLVYPPRPGGRETNRTHEHVLVGRRPTGTLNDTEVLHSLVSAGVRFVVIGTAAVARLAPDRLEAPPKDLDLLLHPADAARAAAVLAAHDGRLWSWNDPVGPGAIRGDDDRLYFRGVLGPPRGRRLVVDVTYTCEPLPFPEAWTDRVDVAGVPCASRAHIARLMRARGRPRDLRRAARLTA